MASDAQSIVDQLSSRIGVPALLEDPEHRTIAYSSQAGPTDSVRRESILHRTTPPDLMAWFRGFGILDSPHPLWLPANVELDVLPRVCAPVRYRDQLMGFLWLIDPCGSISDEDLAEIERTAERAALLLYRERLAGRIAAQALHHLLSASDELREAAAAQLAEESLWRPDEPVAVVAVESVDLGAEPPAPGAIEAALLDASWEAPPGALLWLALADHGVLFVRATGPADEALAESLATACRKSFARRIGPGDRAARVVAALGDPQPHLGSAAVSYRQARLAARVARAAPLYGDTVRWRDLGAFRALVQLPNPDAVRSALDPRVAALLATGDETIVATLETYLDLAGDAKATAERLHLHRGTLYYRLEKAQRLSGVDLHDGADRLAVHVGLKLARLDGRI